MTKITKLTYILGQKGSAHTLGVRLVGDFRGDFRENFRGEF